MRVGIILNNLAADAGGGYTFQADVFSAVPELASASEHEFIVFYNTKSVGKYRNEPGFNKITFVEIPFPKFPQRLKSKVKRLISLVKKMPASPDYIEKTMLSHDVEIVWFVSGGWWKPLDIPYIATIWDLMHLSDPWFSEVSANGEWESRELALKSFLKRATAIITGTQVGRNEIERFYNVPSERIYLLPHPTPRFALKSSGMRNAVLSRYGITGKYLLYPAQFWPHKNHIGLLQVLKNLEELGANDYSLVLVGSDKGNLSFVKQRAAELGLMNKIFFLGFVPTEDLISLYQNAFALTYVSFCGPENLPPLEAFGLGCPVLASDIPGAREQLGNSAWLINPTKPKEMAKAILALEADVEKRELLIKQGLNRAGWTSTDYVKGVFSILDGFASIRACWPSSH